MCFFSLITVCLNPGEKLRKTLESALSQTFEDFEIILQDGGSRDGSLDKIPDLLADKRVKLAVEKDSGIYDGMNRAVARCNGKYVYFLNCGDSLYDKEVLERVAEEENRLATQLRDGERPVIYGNIFSGKTKTWITPPPEITGFTCYRNIPCHQACFYHADLCREKPFETKYRIRGDYEHFLWCFYRGKARMDYLDVPVAEYEGGGFSETKENLKRSAGEHREITEKYMGRGELMKYRTIMALTLAPLRTALAESKCFSGIYNRLVRGIYRR